MGKMITIDELAAHLSVNKRTLYRLARSGELPGFQVGTAWRFDMADITEWIEKKKGVADTDDASAGAIFHG